jgi:hypothetical protein
MSNVKAQSSNEIQNSNGKQVLLRHFDEHHVLLFDHLTLI